MDIEQAAELIFSEGEQGRWYPEALRGKLTLEDGHRVQLGVRDRRLAAGAQAGWKVGLTSARVRARFGTEERPFGHLMETGFHDSGARVPLFPNAAIEPELCFTFGQRLAGPGVAPENARSAVSAVSAAFELNQSRAGGVSDFPLTVADNLSQWGIVMGQTQSPLPPGFDFDALTVTLRKGGEVVSSAIGREVIDDHFLSLSILANKLGEFGQAIEPGMRVITGSYSKVDVQAGEQWEAEFQGIGLVAVSF